MKLSTLKQEIAKRFPKPTKKQLTGALMVLVGASPLITAMMKEKGFLLAIVAIVLAFCSIALILGGLCLMLEEGEP